MASRKARLERQLQLATERGLLHLVPEKHRPVETPGKLVLNLPRGHKPYPATLNEPDPHDNREYFKPIDTTPCPCKSAGIMEGRVKVEGGWCIDGRFWSHESIYEMKRLRSLGDVSEPVMISVTSALEKLHDGLGADLGRIKVALNVR